MIRLAIFVFLVIVVYKQCGAYILPAQGVDARLAGKTYHFCSESCRDQFLLEHADNVD
jgi:hypothetical protein